MLGDAIESVLGRRYAIKVKCDAQTKKEEINAIRLIEKANKMNLENHPEV
jgi:hypothetical protein